MTHRYFASSNVPKQLRPSSTDVVSFQAFRTSARGSWSLLVSTETSSCVLRGERMSSWLSAWLQQWQAPTTTSAGSSPQTSLAFGRRADASGLARRLAQARR